MTKEGKPEQVHVFATGLNTPFGIAFYPLGANPQWVYVANMNSVVRFSYHSGDLEATGPARASRRSAQRGPPPFERYSVLPRR